MNPLKICPECGGCGWVREFKFVEGTYRLRDVECTTCNRTGFVLSTNADRIRAMSDEELAEFLERVHVDPCSACCDNLYWCRRNNAPEPFCQKHLFIWLQQPAEEVCGMKGLYSRYEVRKRSDGTPVNNCFVLRPDRDDAAIAAMLAYADATSDSQLAKELREWVEFEQRMRCKSDT